MPTASNDSLMANSLLTSLVKVELPKMGISFATGIEKEVAEYRADTTGRVHEEVRRAVGVAVRAFVEALDAPSRGGDTNETYREAFRRVGRLEAQAGRSHDTLQTAYRSAERQILSWISDRCGELSIEEPVRKKIELKVAAFIDRLARISAEGFAEAQAEQEGDAKIRNQLIILLLREGVPRRAIEELALQIGWRVPANVRMLEFTSDLTVALAAGEFRSGLAAAEGFVGQHGSRTIGVIEASVDLTNLRAVMPGHACLVVGPAVPLADARLSARIACRASRDVQCRGNRTVHCDAGLLGLLGAAADEVMHVLAVARLQPLAHFSIEKRVKLGRLLSAWLEHGTLHADVPGVLDKSRHTLRYQVGQLESLFGTSLERRDDRVELMLALRAALPRWETELAAFHRRKKAVMGKVAQDARELTT